MPMPVSETAIHTASRWTSRGSSPARPAGAGRGAWVWTADKVIRPSSGVNLDAFDRRLNSTCRTRVPSAMIGNGASSRLTSQCWRLAVRRLAVSATAPVIASRTSVAARVRAMRPASIFDRSRMSLISPSRCRPLRSTASRNSRCSSGTSPAPPLRMRSEKPMIALSGVRSSCDMFARNSPLRRAARWSSAFFWISSRSLRRISSKVRARSSATTAWSPSVRRS
jgi:hypothetical protein